MEPRLTSVPRTCQAATGGEDALDEWCTVMRALCSNCLDLASGVKEEDLSILNALDLDLSLDTRAQLQTGDVFEFIFSHGS